MTDDQGTRRLMLAVTSIMSGGIGSYAMTVCAVLASQGWDIHLLVTNERGDLFDAASRSFKVHDLSDLPLSAGKVKQAAIVVNRMLPEILLLNHCSLLHYALPLLDARVRPIAVVHSDDHRFYVTATMFAKRIFRWIVPTRRLANRLAGYVGGSRRNRIRLVAHGVDPGRFRRPGSPGRSHPVATFVGFVDTNKGVDLLPKIMSIVADAVPDATLRVIGDGPLRTQVERDFLERGLLDRCSFLGRRQHGEVAETLKQSDVLIHPTRIEGFGLTIIEAMAAGVVPVVTRLEGITDEIIQDGVNGFLIDPDDAAGFAQRVSELLLDPEKRSRMGRAAANRVEQCFSDRVMLEAYAGVFGEADDRGEIKGPVGTASWFLEASIERLAAKLKLWLPAAR